jgi:heat shock protein HslJ
MKRSMPFLAMIIFLGSCSSPKETTMTTTSSSQALEPADSIVYVKAPLEFEQKDFLPQMLGNWSLNSMQRQTKLPLETLQNITFTLNTGGTFNANTGCGTLSGNYTVKGVSIKFNNINSSLANCSNTDQLNEMVRLLQNTVSMYTVDGNEMTFRDNSSNIIFQARKN